MQEHSSNSAPVRLPRIKKLIARVLWLCRTLCLLTTSRLSSSARSISKFLTSRRLSLSLRASSRVREISPIASASFSTSPSDSKSSQTFPLYWVLRGMAQVELNWTEVECLALRELFRNPNYKILQVVWLRSQAQLVQVLLDPAALGERELCELRGQGKQLRLDQLMPQLVEQALADFKAQRGAESQEETDNASTAI